jgi:CxC2 like cysteine cluster associated with KDZ transposases
MYFDVLQTQNDFLQEWKDNACNLHLSEIMELEAPPENQDCMLCHKPLALYRCFNCLYSTQLVCLDCCLLQHRCHPFHQIKKWTGTFFDRSDLGDMGLTINLGHGGNLCPGYKTGLPHTVIDEQRIWDEDSNDDESLEELLPGMDSFQQTHGLTFVTSSGVFKRPVKWCICPNAPSTHLQLLRMRFFPASLQKPSTAFTFDVLKLFHIDVMESKTAARSFYSKLQRMTNSGFPSSLPVSNKIC